MGSTSRHDAWQAGDSYEAYMGRWSRPVALQFVDWLRPERQLDWLEVGCGTGALTAAVVRQADPARVTALDPSEGFVAKARQSVGDPRVEFLVRGAASLPALPAEHFDLAVAGLALNFIPDRLEALREMKRVLRPGGTVAFYVWDYPGGGVQFMRAFWNAAASLDPAARELAEDKRFPFCATDRLVDLVREAGFASPEVRPIEVPCVFANFDDYWRPFTMGAGPAPGYCASLPEEARQRLKEKLWGDLPREEDGSIHLRNRAWAVRATRSEE